MLAEALGLQVLFHDIAPELPMGNNRPAESLEALLARADFVTLHVPETPRTRGLIGERELAQMKPGACLLNLSRGSVVDVPALAQALRSGHLAGAAVDVFPEEPEGNADDFTTELQGLPNVILTPHVGGSTEEAQEAIGREVANTLVKFVNTGATTGAVNFPHVEPPPLRERAPPAQRPPQRARRPQPHQQDRVRRPGQHREPDPGHDVVDRLPGDGPQPRGVEGGPPADVRARHQHPHPRPVLKLSRAAAAA